MRPGRVGCVRELRCIHQYVSHRCLPRCCCHAHAMSRFRNTVGGCGEGRPACVSNLQNHRRILDKLACLDVHRLRLDVVGCRGLASVGACRCRCCDRGAMCWPWNRPGRVERFIRWAEAGQCLFLSTACVVHAYVRMFVCAYGMPLSCRCVWLHVLCVRACGQLTTRVRGSAGVIHLGGGCVW